MKAISRRTLLRGAGCALALPLLDAMVPTASASSPAKPPVRAGFLYFPNGVWPADWQPKDAGEDYTLPFSLEPLAPVREDVLVVSGLDKKNSERGDGHYAKTANFLTGMPVAKTTGRDLSSGGESVDQLLARTVGRETPLPSLELSTDPPVTGIDLAVGYTRLYGSHISWRSATEPVAREINPRTVYERLFQAPMSAAKTREHRNLLDFVLDDSRRLRRKVGRDDVAKIDEYLESVRAVERRIEWASKPDPRAWRPSTPGDVAPPTPGIPSDFRDHVRTMLDLMVMAWRTDATRVASFMFARDVSTRNFAFLDGVKGSHHELSHHENDASKIDQYRRVARWHAAQFAYLVRELAKVPEGEGTLLDNVMVMCGSSFSDGNAHDPHNLPILLAGRGGGTVRTGRHLDTRPMSDDGHTPLCNLYVSMLSSMGVTAPSFGDSTGKLDLS